jgi:hypothetical protein
MAPTDYSAATTWAAQHVLALVEIWALFAQHSGFVGAWRLMGVCRVSRAGVQEWLGTLPGLVLIGGRDGRWRPVSEVWRLDLATLQWKPMPALVVARHDHACCVVRKALVVLGGCFEDPEEGITSRVEILSGGSGNGVFTDLPALSCGETTTAVAIAVEESDSVAGQVLLLGGFIDLDDTWLFDTSSVHLVDLATGVCTPQPGLLDGRSSFAAVCTPDGRIVCAGGHGSLASVEVWGPPEVGPSSAPWIWTWLPEMNDGRYDCCGCVMSDGRFAVLGGRNNGPGGDTSTCEALMIDDDEEWHWLHPMHHVRSGFACAAVARCIIVAGGRNTTSTEVYDEALERWILLPCDLPTGNNNLFEMMGSALL